MALNGASHNVPGEKTGPLTGQPPKLSSEAKADLLNSSEQSNGQSAPGKDVPTLPSKAVEKDDLIIPLIDFSAFLKGDTASKKITALAILHAFQTSGFIYLSNYGISDATVQSVFRSSASFFSRPQDQKDALAWYSPEANRGYTGHGREKTTHLTEKEDVEALRAEVPDLKESMEIGRDDEEGMPNMWLPEDDVEGQEFKKVTLAFFNECKALHGEVMRAIAVGLGIEESWFDGFTDQGDNTLRLLHYPAVSREVFQKNKLQVRAGAHSDYGSITLLFQDSRGGLQVQSPNGTFIDATPIPGTIVVNAGDLLARWSNDTIKSTTHRVVEPPPKPEYEGLDEYPARYSVAYFCNPNFNRTVESIPSTCKEGEKPKYEAINSGEYLVRRLAATY